MKTKMLIRFLESGKIHHYPGEIVGRNKKINEIIQKLLEYGELKKMLADIVDPLIDVCEFMLAVLGEDE